MKNLLLLIAGAIVAGFVYEAGYQRARADALEDDLEGALALADAANHELGTWRDGGDDFPSEVDG